MILGGGPGDLGPSSTGPPVLAPVRTRTVGVTDTSVTEIRSLAPHSFEGVAHRVLFGNFDASAPDWPGCSGPSFCVRRIETVGLTQVEREVREPRFPSRYLTRRGPLLSPLGLS